MLKSPLFYLGQDTGSAFWILLGVYFVSETLIARFLRAGRADRTDDRGSLRLFATILPLGWLVAFVLAGIPWAFFGNAALYWAGLVAIGAGQLLRWWSIVTLGRFFTVNVAIRTEHRLIASDPYHYVLHPAYTAVLLVHLGTALCLGNAVSVLALTVPLLARLVNRMRVEEEVLIAGLGRRTAITSDARNDWSRGSTSAAIVKSLQSGPLRDQSQSSDFRRARSRSKSSIRSDIAVAAANSLTHSRTKSTFASGWASSSPSMS